MSDCKNVQCKQVHELLDSFMALFGKMGSPHQVSATKAAIVCDEIRKREDELTTLRTRLAEVEAERDEAKRLLVETLKFSHFGMPGVFPKPDWFARRDTFLNPKPQ